MNQNCTDFISMHVGCKDFKTKLQQKLEIVMKNKKRMKADLLNYVNTSLWSKCEINLSKIRIHTCPNLKPKRLQIMNPSKDRALSPNRG